MSAAADPEPETGSNPGPDSAPDPRLNPGPDPRLDSGLDTERDRERRRRRLADVFGEVLPESTGDDRDLDGSVAGEGRDAEIRREVPPHHG